MDTPCHLNLNRTGRSLLQDIKVLKIKIEDRIDATTSNNPEILVGKFAVIVNCKDTRRKTVSKWIAMDT
jgi:hypothetical protein